MTRKDLTFEKALAELEATLGHLESDELTLDESLKHFEQGIALMRVCETHLKSAEGKLRELLKGENGEMVERILGSTADAIIGREEPNE
jgi:exodeoxyribonuclease VII small subunit